MARNFVFCLTILLLILRTNCPTTKGDDVDAVVSTAIFEGTSPNRLACDTMLRKVPDGSWVMAMLGGSDTEPLPQNRIYLSRSNDEGSTWSSMQPVDLGVKSKSPETALVPTELMVHGNRCTLFVATHDGTFADWREWMTHSDDSCQTWGPLIPAPGRLRERTFIRNHIVTSDGRLMLPFQHYLRVEKTRDSSKGRKISSPTDPRNGVIISDDGGKTWSEHGNIRLTDDKDYHGWAENNIVELSEGRIAMIIRADRLGGVLHYAESTDGGRTWPEFARMTEIPNPGSKATLYGLGGDSVAILHNPNPKHRSPLALWVSHDGLKTWPNRHVLVPESVDGSQGRLNYPDGFVSDDGRFLHFAFDDNRHRAVYVRAKLPRTAGSNKETSSSPIPPSVADVIGADRTRMLNLAETGTDPSVIDFQELPRLPSQHAVISDVRDQGGKWVNQHAYLAHHQGRFWAIWSDGPGLQRPGLTPQQHRNVVPGHDRPGTQVSYATSVDGFHWTPPSDLSGPPRIDGFGWIARGLWVRNGELLALASHFNAPGYPGEGLSLEAFRWNPMTQAWEPHGTVQDDTLNNFPPKRLPSGQYMMTRRDHRQQVSVLVGGVISFDDWQEHSLASYDKKGRPEEPYWYVLPDGQTIVGLIRDNGRSGRLLRTFSNDNGQTWTRIVRTNFPDATSKFFVRRTSRGFYVLVSNANPKGRDPLTLAVSRDGLIFTHLFRLVGGRHIDYPHIIEQDEHLLVSFSGAKQTVEVLKISLDNLDQEISPEHGGLDESP